MKLERQDILPSPLAAGDSILTCPFLGVASVVPAFSLHIVQAVKVKPGGSARSTPILFYSGLSENPKKPCVMEL
jgi:hypothetical protein